MKLCLVFVGIQCFLHFASVFGTLSGIYPEGQEVLYSYSAIVTAGTKSPAQFVSQFNLTGNIKVQGFKNKARVQFLNLKYAMYSGDFQAEKKLKIAKLPESSASLYEPFDILYKDGQVEKLELTSGTPPWSKGIKQALSGILQLDLPKVNSERFTSFVSTEQSIHGKCPVLYSVKPQKNKLHITKFYSADDCQRTPTEWSNVDNIPGCSNDEPQLDQLESFSQKTYRVAPYSDATLLIREMFSEGKTYRFLGKNSNSSHFITVSQKLQLVSMNGISRVVEIPNPEEINTLEYDATQFSLFKFSTNENLNKVLKKVFYLFQAVRSGLDGKNNLLSEEINPEEAHLIPLLITYMRKLDLNLLQQIYNYLTKMNNTSSIDMFTKMLPLVGSQDSAKFLVKLVKENKVTDFVAEQVISSLPFHTRQLSAEHLTEFEDLLALPESISNDVRNTAVLSFATLVSRTCRFVSCKPEIIKKYTLHFIESSNEYLKQQVYLAALSNLRLTNIVDFLEPIISGEEPSSSEGVRVFGLRAVFPVVASNPDKAYEVYWPVLVNRENSLELRATAMVLLMEAQQEPAIFMQLQQVVAADEINSHLHNIYYKLMKSYSEENLHCFSMRTKIACQMMKSLKRPVISDFPSSHYTFSIADRQLKVLTIVNPKIADGISIYITFSSTSTENPVNYYSAYMKLRGTDGDFLNNVVRTIFDSSRPEAMLKTFIKSDILSQDFQMQFILFSQQQVIILKNYDKNNIEDFLKGLISILQSEDLPKFSWFYATSLFNKETFFVTDLGFPGVLSLDFPTLSSFHTQTKTDDGSNSATNKYTSLDLRYWSQGSTVLKVKNTLVDIWQGVINSHVSHFNFPLNLVIKLENQLGLQITPAADTVLDNNYAGFKWHTQTDIFTVTNSENYDALSVSCNECNSTTSVKNKIAENVERELHNKGYNLYKRIFSCEDDGTPTLLKSVTNFDLLNIIDTLGTIFSAGFFLENHLLEVPITGSCGYTTVYSPSKEYTICVDSRHQRNNFTLMIGSSDVMDEKCVADNIIISFTTEDIKKHSSMEKEKLMGECKRKLAAGFEEKIKEQFKGKVGTCGIGKSNGYEENLEWCEKEMKPQIMNCVQTEINERNQENSMKFDLKINKFAKDIEQSADVLITDYLGDRLKNEPSNEGLKTKPQMGVTILINVAKSICSLNLQLPSKNIVFVDIPLS